MPLTGNGSQVYNSPNYVAIWSLKRGPIDPPEALDAGNARQVELADALHRKPVRSVTVEDMWASQGREFAMEKRLRVLARKREHRKLRKEIA